MPAITPKGFHLAVHYFEFGTSEETRQRVTRERKELRQALQLREHLKTAGVPEIEIQMVPNSVHQLMTFIEKEPYFDLNNPTYRNALFEVARKLSESRPVREFERSAYKDKGRFHVDLEEELSGTAKELPHPNPKSREALRLSALIYLQKRVPRLLAETVKRKRNSSGTSVVYSDSNLYMTETEKRRLKDLVTSFDRRGKRRVLVTGSEVGMCLNAAMDMVRSFAPNITQVAVEDCCHMNYARGGMGMSFPHWSQTTQYEHVDSPEKLKAFFLMGEGKQPELRKPFQWPKHI